MVKLQFWDSGTVWSTPFGAIIPKFNLLGSHLLVKYMYLKIIIIGYEYVKLYVYQ